MVQPNHRALCMVCVGRSGVLFGAGCRRPSVEQIVMYKMVFLVRDKDSPEVTKGVSRVP